MVRTLLIRGMLVGVLAGLLAAGFAYVFGEPSVDWAIAFEEQAAKAAGEPEEAELVSRSVQSTIGLLTGITLVGAALGGLFGIAFAFAQGRLGRMSPGATALVLALAGFVVLLLVPQLKYPANPPAVGSPDTIGLRTNLYFGLLGLSVLFAGLGFAFGQAVSRNKGRWAGTLAGAILYVTAIGIALAAMPTINEVPDAFSPAVLWNFRVATLGIGVVMWATLGLGLGSLAEWWPLRNMQR